MQDEILKALNWRYAVKMFDSSKPLAPELLKTILESGRFAPSSLGIEPWKFIVVDNKEMRAKLKEVSYGQPKVTDAAHLIVVAFRTDGENMAAERLERTARMQKQEVSELGGLKQMIDGTVAGWSAAGMLQGWLKAQAYIPLGMMIETAALLGVDACPMEGFDPAKVNELLGLNDKHLFATAMLAVGYRGEDPEALRPKVRRSFEEVVEII